MNEPIGCALCGGNDHNADECKRFAGEREAISEIRQRALELYEPPFQFHCGYIQDAKHRMVADQHEGPDSLRVRGWGRISYMEDPEKLQDEVGALIAEALTEKWAGTAPHPAPAPTEQELELAGLGYPLSKDSAIKLWHDGFRSEPITVLEAWEAIGHDIACNPSKSELLESLRNMAAICDAHGNDMPAPAQDVAGWIPVAERLPEVAQEVIVSTEFEGVCAGILDSYGEWFAPCSEYKLTRVTHWMPLPAAPEVV